MKKKFYIIPLVVFILFVPGVQNTFAQKILQDWFKHLKAVPPSDQYSAMAGVDENGNAYWISNTQDSISLEYNTHLVKYDTLGHLLWANHYQGTGGLSMTDFKTLSDGSTYTYGVDFGAGNGGTQDCFLYKNDMDGNLLWSVSYDPDPDAIEYSDQIYVSPVNGDIVITAYETAPQYKLFLARYTQDGVPVWQTNVPDYEAGDIMMDESDNIYLLGTYHWGASPDETYFAYLRFDGDGNLLSYYHHTGGGTSHALATSGKGKTIGMDNNGNVYALCWVDAFPNSDTAWTHIMLNKFNSNGALEWKKRLEWVKKGYPKEVATLLTDPATSEAIVIGGWGMWKYDPDGNFMGGWYDCRRNYMDACQFNQQKMFTLSSGIMTMDGDSGKLAMFDWSDENSYLYEKGRGNMQPLNKTAIVVPDMAHDALFVTWSFDDSVALHRVILRNNAVATGVSDPTALANGLQVYPNPSNDVTTVSFGDNLNSPFTLDIYSATGVRVMHENYSHSSSVQLSVKDFAPGVYQVVVNSNRTEHHEKLVVMR